MHGDPARHMVLPVHTENPGSVDAVAAGGESGSAGHVQICIGYSQTTTWS